MLGEKLTPFVTGKSAIPQAFRKTLGVNKATKEIIKPPPVKWSNNTKAWMTSELFTSCPFDARD